MRIKIVFWGLICLLLIGGQVSVYAETEDRTSSISDEIKESISLDEIDDNLKNKSENRIPFDFPIMSKECVRETVNCRLIPLQIT